MRVFLVEDSPIVRQSLIEAMQDLVGAIVVGWAAGEVDAKTELARLGGQWDVAIIDLFLLDGSGLGVAGTLGGRQPHQKVYLVTNYATADTRRRAMAIGIDAVFDKSTELDALIDQLVGS